MNILIILSIIFFLLLILMSINVKIEIENLKFIAPKIKERYTNKESRVAMTNILDCLENNGLIKIQDGFVGQKPIKKLI